MRDFMRRLTALAPTVLAALLPFALHASPRPAASVGSGSDAPSDTWEPNTFSLLPRAFQKNPHLNVMIVTEFTPAGKQLPAADSAHPQYYVLLPGNYTSVGDVVAGEEPPKEQDLENILRHSLAQAGYLPSDAAHPPTLVVHFNWGSWNQLTSLTNLASGVGSSQEDDDSDDMQLENFLQRAALVGGTQFAAEVLQHENAGNIQVWEESSPKVAFLMSEVRSNRYFVIADAYDYQAALKTQQVLLWRTKISTNAEGVMMNESVPQIVASAGPYLGHPTDGPVRLNRPVVKEGQVIIGTPTVKPDQQPDDSGK